jgi:hypothetical protein
VNFYSTSVAQLWITAMGFAAPSKAAHKMQANDPSDDFCGSGSARHSSMNLRRFRRLRMVRGKAATWRRPTSL